MLNPELRGRPGLQRSCLMSRAQAAGDVWAAAVSAGMLQHSHGFMQKDLCKSWKGAR